MAKTKAGPKFINSLSGVNNPQRVEVEWPVTRAPYHHSHLPLEANLRFITSQKVLAKT